MRLSASSLNLYLRCQRCFWLKMNHKLPPPRGIFPSIAGGVDRRMQEYMDNWRNMKEGLPKILTNVMADNYELANPKVASLLAKEVEEGVDLYGILDDCLVSSSGRHYPLDFKTKGKEPDEVHEAYRVQMDVYALLLQLTGYKAGRWAFLVYFTPELIGPREKRVKLQTWSKRIITNPGRAKGLISRAAACARSTTPPDSDEDCPYCNWHRKVTRVMRDEEEET